MRIAVFTMFRNEAPILNPFMDQLDEFFDLKYLVDHELSDLSGKVIADRQRDNSYNIFSLKAAGYPQSKLATFFTRKIFNEFDVEWIFFLDCDEFLRFNNKEELIHALKLVQHADYVTYNWRNVVPIEFDDGDIFKKKFLTFEEQSPFRKIAISRRLFNRDPDIVIEQGYHGVASKVGGMKASVLSEVGLIHVPIQSKFRFAAKIRAASNRIMNDPTWKIRGDGYHWINYHRKLEAEGLSSFDFRAAALAYPGDNTKQCSKAIELDFSFPYVSTPFQENFTEVMTELYADPKFGASNNEGFVLYDTSGVLLETTGVEKTEIVEDSNIVFENGDFGGEFYADLIEPLFSLPLKMPQTAWSGHIPILFTLFRLMRPTNYVELGVHLGGSLIAAATASRSYQIPMRIYGVDSWEGDEHAGKYSGDTIFNDLASFVSTHFKNVQLMRSYFDDAARNFKARSIDILHIDGLHTYDAVKQDFLTWLPKMSNTGIIMFHDTCVYEKGFGVHRFWKELQQKFTTLEFFHSHGLGLLFLDPSLPSIAPLVKIAKNENIRSIYQSLVSDIAGLITVRMQSLEQNRSASSGMEQVRRLEAERDFLIGEAAALRTELQRATNRTLSRILRKIFGRSSVAHD